MKKIIFLAIVFLIAVSVHASAPQTIENARIQFSGTGAGIYGWEANQTTISIAQVLMGIKEVSVVVGAFPALIRQHSPQNQPELVHSNRILNEFVDVRRRGILRLGERRYGLNEIVIEENSFKGNVYSSPSAHGELIGTFTLTKNQTTDEINQIWFGSLKITENEETKQLGLFINMRKLYTIKQISEKIEHYCLKVGQGSTQCLWLEEQEKGYCERNPNNEKCQELQIRYCVKNANVDVRCNNLIKRYCERTTATKMPDFCINEKIDGKIQTGINQAAVKQQTQINAITTEDQRPWWIQQKIQQPTQPKGIEEN